MNTPAPSYWESTTLLRPADVAVIGGGLTGLQAALALKRTNPKLDVALLERAPIPRGASTRNAGFACFGGPTELLADLAAYGPESVVATVRERYAGVQALATNFAHRDIDWHRYGGYELIDEPATANMVRTKLPELNALLAPITGQPKTWRIVAESPHLLLHNELEGQLHPGKLVSLLLDDCRRAGVRLLFGCPVETIAEPVNGTVRVAGAGWGSLTAGRILLTVNAFASALLPEDFPEEIRPVRNQVLLSRPLDRLPVRGCYHYHEGYVYFRNVGEDRLLVGGGRHLAGVQSETDRFGDNPQVAAYLIGKLNRWFPDRRWRPEDFPQRWSGIIAQGDGKSPVLRLVNERTLVAGRLAGMGVALSAALAERAARRLYES